MGNGRLTTGKAHPDPIAENVFDPRGLNSGRWERELTSSLTTVDALDRLRAGWAAATASSSLLKCELREDIHDVNVNVPFKRHNKFREYCEPLPTPRVKFRRLTAPRRVNIKNADPRSIQETFRAYVQWHIRVHVMDASFNS
jgi:hypothetical protein